MMHKNTVLRNAGASAFHVTASTVVFFGLYYYLLRAIGAEKIGLWSIVVATVSAAQIGGFGLSGGVVKFVSKYVALREDEKAASCVETGAISVALLVGGMLFILYPLFLFILDLVLPPETIAQGKTLLPFSLCSFLISAIASVFLSGLDGVQRIDIRCFLMTGLAVFHLILTLVLVPSHELMGLVYSQLAQSTLMLLLSWYFLRNCLRGLSLVPINWSNQVFREMFKYGISFQFTSVVQTLFSPVTKALLSKFGGLSAVSYFEMANRMVIQCRSLLVAANQVLVPVISGMQETRPSGVKELYDASVRLLLFLALPMYSVLASLIPIISSFWIGDDEVIFIVFAIMLTVSWFLNNLTVPAYFGNLGSGSLRGNVVAHVAIGVSNVAIAMPLGLLYGAVGVVAGFCLALVAGSLLLAVIYHLENDIPFDVFVNSRYLGFVSICVLSPILSWIIFYYTKDAFGVALASLICICLSVILVVLAMWRQPIRSKLFAWIASEQIP